MTPDTEWALPATHIGRRVWLWNQLGSTNDQAAALARQPGVDGLVLLAREQTAGRGQHGRSWQAPASSSVLLSALLFPPAALQRPVLLTAWAAVAVCQTIHGLTGLVPRIKWPNDVLLGRRKVCGILIEQKHAVIAGIGLNVAQGQDFFASAGLTEATSLALETGRAFSWEDVARSLILRLDRDYDCLLQGQRAELEAVWREHLGLLGEQVVAECHEGNLSGILREISFDGVILETSQELVNLAPERILHLVPSG